MIITKIYCHGDRNKYQKKVCDIVERFQNSTWFFLVLSSRFYISNNFCQIKTQNKKTVFPTPKSSEEQHKYPTLERFFVDLKFTKKRANVSADIFVYIYCGSGKTFCYMYAPKFLVLGPYWQNKWLKHFMPNKKSTLLLIIFKQLFCAWHFR